MSDNRYRNPALMRVAKGVLLAELLGLVGVYCLYFKMDGSQDFRYKVHKRVPLVLEAYYKSNEWSGKEGQRLLDQYAWLEQGKRDR
ncbi:protein CEBPZOS [Lethenteron reissneri]|uniref:protein CEBPZOS n=1 Tax=Lethenteron reissneri TaxID=7753 RepID=UPI002AB63B84|nr:protein CEBPZOS [Lethenteron reissneri]